MRVMNREPPGWALAQPVQSYHSPSIFRRRSLFRRRSALDPESPEDSAVSSGASSVFAPKGLRKAARGPDTSPRRARRGRAEEAIAARPRVETAGRTGPAPTDARRAVAREGARAPTRIGDPTDAASADAIAREGGGRGRATVFSTAARASGDDEFARRAGGGRDRRETLARGRRNRGVTRRPDRRKVTRGAVCARGRAAARGGATATRSRVARGSLRGRRGSWGSSEGYLSPPNVPRLPNTDFMRLRSHR